MEKKEGNSFSAHDKKSTSGKELKKEYREDLEMFEQSLINYLLQRKEVINSIPGGAQRVRSLIFGLNCRNPEDPLFTVQIGMFEVSFSIISGGKDRGSLYNIERYIIDWYRQIDISKRLEDIAIHMKNQ